MRKGIVQRGLALTAAVCLTVGGFSGCSKKEKETTKTEDPKEAVTPSADNTDTPQDAPAEDAMQTAMTTTLGKYPETITYKAAYTVDGNTKWGKDSEDPEEAKRFANDTALDNAITRFYKDKLNIQPECFLEAPTGEDYDTKISLAITTGEIPDILKVSYEDFETLVANDQVADLTEAYNNCAGDIMRDIYASYNGTPLDMATVDGKLYGIPTTSIGTGPEMLWLRQDWLDKYNLSAPSTLDEIKNVISTFVKEDPAGGGKTVGLALNPDVFYGNYGSGFSSNTIFNYFGATPRVWVNDADGNVIYGSIMEENKEALQVLADWYKEGLIDKQVATRKYDDLKQLAASGEVGAIFCTWWLPYDIKDSIANDPNAAWTPYMVLPDADGKNTVVNGDPCQYYQVVRKGYKHPELLVKAKSLSLEYNQGTAAQNDDSDVTKDYLLYIGHSWGVDPILGGFDWYDAAARSYTKIQGAIDGTVEINTLSTYENELYNHCVDYIKAKEAGETKVDITQWQDYTCRLVGAKLAYEAQYKQVNPVFFGTTETKKMSWTDLESMEKEAYLKILTNQESVDYFDKFVSEWKKAGGDAVTSEVAEAVAAKNGQ